MGCPELTIEYWFRKSSYAEGFTDNPAILKYYTYVHNSADRRTRMTLSDGSYWDYAYNDKGEVTSGVKKLADGTPVLGQGFGYGYDDIGNRLTSSVDSIATAYTSNILNQYTSILAPSETAVQPAYDADGNILSDSRWNYTWDGENRLVSLESTTGILPVSKVKVQFTYDYQGRRVSKAVYSWNTTTSAWNLVPDTFNKYVWNDWSCIAVLDASNQLVRSYCWGEDGLISDTDNVNGETYLAVKDGNSNITGYVDASTGSLVATYEYDAFGRCIVKAGAKADDFNIRFSSYFFDSETGLVYYGYRYLNPELGRWLSRDPITEDGGLNLYAMCNNDPISRWDYLGLLKVNRDPNEDFACVSTEKGDTLNALGAEIGMLSTQALNGKGWLYTKKDGSEHATSFSAGNVYYIPNIWITANLMHGGDIIDVGIVSWGGVFGSSYKPEGAKEIKESELGKLPGTVFDNKGKIFGITIYAHGDKLGFISNSGNMTRTADWTWGIDWIHTMDVLRALDAGGYKVAESHPMQCYSTYKGRAQYGPLKHNPDSNRYSPGGFKKMFFLRTGLNPTGEVSGTTESVLYYDVDWNAEWHKRAVKVDGYSGVNIIGIDLGN